jgi:hypothetical protein
MKSILPTVRAWALTLGKQTERKQDAKNIWTLKDGMNELSFWQLIAECEDSTPLIPRTSIRHDPWLFLSTSIYDVKFEVFTVVKIQAEVFQVVGYQHSPDNGGSKVLQNGGILP